MAIRRISDLPSLAKGEELSNCIFEVSYKDSENNYHSVYTDASRIGNYTANYINDITLNQLNVDGSLCVTNGPVKIINPSTNTTIYSKDIDLTAEDDINISAKGHVNIDGNQGIRIGKQQNGSNTTIGGNVVIFNGMLSVFNYKDSSGNPILYTKTSHKVIWSNEDNDIWAHTPDYTNINHKNRVVTCELLSNTIGELSTILSHFNTGSGVEL